MNIPSFLKTRPFVTLVITTILSGIVLALVTVPLLGRFDFGIIIAYSVIMGLATTMEIHR